MLRREHKQTPKKSKLLHVYNILVADGEIEEDKGLARSLVKKSSKSTSGVLVVTVLTSPYPTYVGEDGETVTQKFSCQWDCYYCPNECAAHSPPHCTRTAAAEGRGGGGEGSAAPAPPAAPARPAGEGLLAPPCRQPTGGR